MISTPLPRSDLGIEFEAADEGLRITHVAPGSQAEHLGLEPGDTILSLYGHPVTSADIWAWLTSWESDYAELRLRDARTGKVVTCYLIIEAHKPQAWA